MAGGLTTKLDEICIALEAHLGFDQPGLKVSSRDGTVTVTGTYYLNGTGGPSSEGPLAEYEIKLELDPRYPDEEPRLYETAGRIPVGRHLNGNGTCCTGVWEEWLATNPNPSVSAYMDGPLRDYFLSQRHFELTEEWPFGEREHGIEGIIDGAAAVLGIKQDASVVISHLAFLAHRNPKGHWLCPCRSGLIVRRCHGRQVFALREKLSSALANRMLERIAGVRP